MIKHPLEKKKIKKRKKQSKELFIFTRDARICYPNRRDDYCAYKIKTNNRTLFIMV